MVVYLLLEYCTNNISALYIKISCLSNNSKNVMYLYVIWRLTGINRYFNFLHLAAVLIFLPEGCTVIPALTNTLFTIHPPLLYLTGIFTIYSL